MQRQITQLKTRLHCWYNFYEPRTTMNNQKPLKISRQNNLIYEETASQTRFCAAKRETKSGTKLVNTSSSIWTTWINIRDVRKTHQCWEILVKHPKTRRKITEENRYFSQKYRFLAILTWLLSRVLCKSRTTTKTRRR